MTIRYRAISYVLIAILVLATGAAAATSDVTAQPRIAPRAWHGDGSTDPTPVSDPNERSAMVEAQRLLVLAHSAPSWRPVSSPPTSVLATPMATPGTPDVVDLYELWRTGTTLAAVQSWISAHPPTGSSAAGSGSSFGDAEPLETSLTYGYPMVADRFESRQLLVAVAPLPQGETGVRVDAQVVWYRSRPAAEQIPPGIETVTATVYTRSYLVGSPETVLGAASFSSPAVVHRLALLVDALPLAVPGARSCPSDNGTNPQLDLVFSGRAGTPEVVVHDDTNGCGGISFRIGGVAQAPLTDNGLLHGVALLLGLDLSGFNGD